MREYTPALAKVTVRQIKHVVPRYRDMDDLPLERNISLLLRGVVQLLEKSDERWLVSVVRDVAQLRALGGFTTSDFLMAGLCFLPVIRSLLVRKVAPAEEALRLYDEVEAVAIPFLGRITAMFESVALPSMAEADDDQVAAWLGDPPTRMDLRPLVDD